MRADQPSLIELGLLPDAGGRWALSAWLDHTHAPRGREALKRLIASPLDDIDAVQLRQSLLPMIAPITARVAWRELYTLALQVERFLRSNYISVPQARVPRTLLSERVLFLTGPNMAGKSTLLRALGIAICCAHLGMVVAAYSASIPLHDQLFVSITVRDNLQRGESLYLAEVRRVRAIVEAVDRGDSVLAVFDEVFRGTNIKDATQATTLLVDGLAAAAHGTFIIASHLAEVAESRTMRAGVSCWCMQVDVVGDAPRFSYRVQPGVSDIHLGVTLLDSEGVGPILRRLAGYAPAQV